MKAAFDEIAHEYDESFSYSFSGNYQRQQVWTYLKSIGIGKKLNILELNGGTGEDAIFLAKEGHDVLCTDISSNMLQVAKEKVPLDLKEQIHFQEMDMRHVSSLSEQKFDVIFSNFGGMNCLSPKEIQKLLHDLKRLLNQDGRIIAIIMPKFCLTESLYFFFKLNFKQVFRRNTKNEVLVKMEGHSFPIWYYSPSNVLSMCDGETRLIHIQAIGFFTPPSYLNEKYSRIPSLLKTMNGLDNILKGMSFLASASDHFLIDVKARA